MDLIPIEPNDALASFLDSTCRFPLTVVSINHPGDYERENIVLKANEDIDSLYEYILFYIIEDPDTGLPVYDKCRLFTLDDIDFQKDSTLQIHTRSGEDTTSIGFDTGALHKVMYWGLPAAIWHIPHSSLELMHRGNSYCFFPNPPSPDLNE